MKRTLTLIALCAVTALQAQTTYQLTPNPWTNGYNVYGSDGSSQQIIRQPWTGGYNVYSHGANGSLQQSIVTPNPWTGGYTVHTMPCFGCD